MDEEKRFPKEILMSKILQESKRLDEAIKSGKEFSDVKEIKLKMNKLVEELNNMIGSHAENINSKNED